MTVSAYENVMTEEELAAALEATTPEISRLKAEIAETHDLPTPHSVEVAQQQHERLTGLRDDIDAVGGTLSTLLSIAERMKHAAKIPPQVIWAEAVESRVACARLMLSSAPQDAAVENGIPRDWRVEMAALIDARSFYWSPTVVSIVQSSAQALPADTYVDPELFVTKAGWWFLGYDNSHVIVDHHAHGPKRIGAFAWLMIDDSHVWVSALSSDGQPSSKQLVPVWSASIELGRTLNDISMYVPTVDDVGCDAGHIFMLLRFLVGGLLFLRQRVFLDTPAVLPRGARRRIEKHTSESGLQIVHLRRAETLRGHIVDRESGTFGCQWWVRGHWRQQPYKTGVRPKWIDPYIKGDPDAPMKEPTEKVFAVVR